MEKIVFDDNSTLDDITTNLLKFQSGTEIVDFTAAQDKLYIGSFFPFNSIYFNFETANTITSAISAEYWDGNKWKSAVAIVDETDGFKNSGYITFVPNKKYGWARDDTVDSNGTETITGLGNITIYDLYWMRFDFSVTIDVATELNYVGHIFSDDSELYAEYPELNNSTLLTSYASGKTDWKEQHVRASRILIDDLISRKIINSESQILDRRVFMSANVPLTASIIYNSLGDDYIDQRSDAKKEYNIRIKRDILNIDVNNNARLEPKDVNNRQGKLHR